MRATTSGGTSGVRPHLRLVASAGRTVESDDASRAGDPARSCACGHVREAHAHYRRGSDCGACGCGHYRRRPLWARVRSA